MYTSMTDTRGNLLGVSTQVQVYRVLRSFGLSILFAGFTGICAQVRFYFPFTPVPVTGQVFAVLLSGAVLGRKYGPLSQGLYLLLGLSGVPWFVVGPIGPTGGYIVGFIVAPYLIALLREKLEEAKQQGHAHASRTIPALTYLQTLCIMCAGVGVIYLLGLLQFSIFTHTPLYSAVRYSVLPFIPFDLGKALLAAFAIRFLYR
jgi:biotin transport system substrate-specific component